MAEVLKGRGRGRELTVTLLGGTVGDLTTLIVAMNSWTNVPGANHVLSYAEAVTADFITDGMNAVVWATGDGCPHP